MKLVVGQVFEQRINYVQESHSSVKGGKDRQQLAFSFYFDGVEGGISYAL